MTDRKRVDIKDALADPALREEIVEGATDFICKAEGIRPHSLSPAAQAVLDAFRTSHTGQGCLAAALRAAADQVVPEPSNLHKEIVSTAALRLRWVIRDQFLAIANELENKK